MLSLPALLLLVAIGAVGLYLALPRGPESESRAVRLAGACLGAVSGCFLAIATWRSGWADSRLDSLWSSLLFHGLALLAVLTAGAAVSARTARGGSIAVAALLATTGGLLIFAGAPWTGAALVGPGILIAGAILLRSGGTRERMGPQESAIPGNQGLPAELAREPLLACVAGTLLATGLLAAGHAVVIDELPHTAAVERNDRPPSQRYRAVPRTDVLHAILHPDAAEDLSTGSRHSRFTVDLPMLDRLMSTAALVFAVGIAGILCRRSAWAFGISSGTALLAGALLVGAVSGLPFRAEALHVALLLVVVPAIEGGLLLVVGARLSSAAMRPGVSGANRSGGPP